MNGMGRKIDNIYSTITFIGAVFIALGLAIIFGHNLNINMLIINNILVAATSYTILLSVADLIDYFFVSNKILKELNKNLGDFSNINSEKQLEEYFENAENIETKISSNMKKVSAFMIRSSMPVTIVCLIAPPIENTLTITGISILGFGMSITAYGCNQYFEMKKYILKLRIKSIYYERKSKDKENVNAR